MAAVYFLGSKEITSKKSGRKFFPCTFLTRNNWGDWTTVTKFCDSETVFQSTKDIEIGSPVVCSFGMNNELLNVVAHDTVPALLLDDGM